MSTSKTGKHGHAKCNFTATDIFTGKKLEDMCPSTHNVDVRFPSSCPVACLRLYASVPSEDGMLHSQPTAYHCISLSHPQFDLRAATW